MKRWETLVFLLIVGISVYGSFLFEGFIQDDAYIFARYAQNLAHGHGFVYNIGEHTEGATSFLWTLLAGVAAHLGADLPQYLKMASLAGFVAWLLAFFLVCRQWLTRPWQWVAPVLLFAVFPSALLWSQAGLEVCFFGFLVTTGFYLVEAWHQNGSKAYFRWLCAVAALLILTRPEGVPVVGLYAIYVFLYPHAGQRKMLYTLFTPVTAVTLVGLLGFRYLYFHDWVPNTYYAKGGGGYYLWRLGLGKLNVFLRSNLTVLFFMAALPVFVVKSRIRLLVAMVPLWALYYIKSGGDILPEHRLLLPAVPFMFLGAFYFFDQLRTFYTASVWRERLYLLATLVLAGIFVLRYHYYYTQNLIAYTGVEEALERAHGKIGRYLDTHMQPHDSAILTDAGMTAFYAHDKHLVDWLGLCDKRVARVLYESGYNPWALYYCHDEAERQRRQKACHEGMQTYFGELNPRYAVLNIFVDESVEQQAEMLRFSQHLPDTLPHFVTQHISFDGYFGVFTPANRARNYKPLLAVVYNPTFWMVLAERGKTKSPSR